MYRAPDVWAEQENRREKRMAAMRPVLGDIQRKIRQQAIHDANAPYIVFEVPSQVFGYPLYRIDDARDYLMRNLQEARQHVWVVDDKQLLISWMKMEAGKTPSRPTLTTNQRPQVQDPTAIGFASR